jgi:hypothetical protein
VSSFEPLARIEVGVVVERRKALSAWVDFVWQPTAILAGRPEAAPWTVLATADERTTFYAGSAEIELYRTETGQYRDNLASGAPSLWVALRPTGADPAYRVVAVTADPAEGESWTGAGGDLVDAVPMPASVREAIEAFVAEHHVERPFAKRRRDRPDAQALARRRPLDKE